MLKASLKQLVDKSTFTTYKKADCCKIAPDELEADLKFHGANTKTSFEIENETVTYYKIVGKNIFYIEYQGSYWEIYF